MEAKSLIKMVLDTGDFVLRTYLKDFTDEEMLLRPTAGANQVAWQVGHLLANENRCLAALKSDAAIELADEFLSAYLHAPEADLERQFVLSKEQYLSLLGSQRQLTLSYLASLSTEQLDNPGPEHMRAYAPTIGAALTQQGIHAAMHAGQLAVLRRKLKKPIVI